MNGSTLVSTDEVEKNLAHWRVFDCRHDLARPALGEQQPVLTQFPQNGLEKLPGDPFALRDLGDQGGLPEPALGQNP